MKVGSKGSSAVSQQFRHCRMLRSPTVAINSAVGHEQRMINTTRLSCKDLRHGSFSDEPHFSRIEVIVIEVSEVLIQRDLLHHIVEFLLLLTLFLLQVGDFFVHPAEASFLLTNFLVYALPQY